MKILVVTNLYPPHAHGGYEIGCEAITSGLRRRGHDVLVMTSTYGLRWPVLRGRQRRCLHYRASAASGLAACAQVIGTIWNRLVLARTVRAYRPDVIYAFNLYGLGALVLQWCQTTDRPVVHHVSDDSRLAAYRNDLLYGLRSSGGTSLAGRLSAWVARKLLPDPARLRLDGAIFCSAYLLSAFEKSDTSVTRAAVVHWGARAMPDLARARSGATTSRLVYAGRVESDKGLHVLLEALQKLTSPTHCTIIGVGRDPSYAKELSQLATKLSPNVTLSFQGLVSHDECLAMLAQHDVFVHPVVWEEPFSIALVEAMALGLGVIATATGGTPELVLHGTNGLLVPPDDVAELADAIGTLCTEPELLARLSAGALLTANELDIEDMIDRIGELLREQVDSTRGGVASW